MHVNIFETKSDEELSVLYGQFLEAEKISGFPDDNELGKIKKEYEKDNAEMISMFLLFVFFCSKRKFERFSFF